MLPRTTSFGPYHLLGQLGVGATSHVYRATRGDDPTEIALKILSPAASRDGEWLRRFQRESQVMRRLQHRNIVGFLDYGQLDGRWYIAMERIVGHSGRSLVPRRPTGPFIARFTAQIASALTVAHAQGLIHRDLKPENLIVTNEGIVKVLDLGLARPIHLDGQGMPSDLSEVTATGAVMGTPRYMSPEQSRAETLTPATDIFCLGLCVFEIATGRHPFAATFPRDVITGIREQPAPGLHRWRPDLGPDLAAAIAELLAKDPAARPTAEATYQRFRALSGSA